MRRTHGRAVYRREYAIQAAATAPTKPRRYRKEATRLLHRDGAGLASRRPQSLGSDYRMVRLSLAPLRGMR
jgi:hypothetical protein